MKPAGIVRKLDTLGRISIPIELRKRYGIDKHDPLEILIDEDKIILTKFKPVCTFCENTDNITEYKGKNICGNCVQEIKQD